MSTKAKTDRPEKVKDSYFRLVRELPLLSIRSEQQLEAAQAMVDRLLARGELDAGATMYLDALSDLLATYEDVHYPIAAASDADMLRHLMEARGLSQADVHRQTRIPKSTISEVLTGKKPFSRTMIRTLARFFQVDTSVLASNL